MFHKLKENFSKQTLLSTLVLLITLFSATYIQSMEPAPNKEYLVVLLHGSGGKGEDMSTLLPKLHQVYQNTYPNTDINGIVNKIEFYIPTADINNNCNNWFTIPDMYNIFNIISAVNPIRYLQGHTDKLEGFRKSLNTLNYEIDHKLKDLNLGRDRLILAGISQGGITATTLGLESYQPVKAVINAIGMWIPCQINSYPEHMLLTHGGGDLVIPEKLSTMTEYLLFGHLYFSNTNLKSWHYENDAHTVGDWQLTSIIKFIHENILGK